MHQVFYGDLNCRDETNTIVYNKGSTVCKGAKEEKKEHAREGYPPPPRPTPCVYVEWGFAIMAHYV